MDTNPTPLSPRPERPPARTIAGLRLIGGRLCLDFVNTLAWRGAGHPNERLHGYADLVTWNLRTGTLSRPDSKALRDRAAADPIAAEAVLARSLVFREALHRLFTGTGLAHSTEDLDAVNLELSRAPPRQHLHGQDDGFVWSGNDRDSDLDCVLWPIVWSGADLLVDLPARVKACGDTACGALFYDASRNRSRRWCVMEDCGNRAKARRHYARRKNPKK